MRGLFVFVCLLTTFAARGQDPFKLAPPDEAAEKEATAFIAETFKAEYGRAKTPSQKLELAKKLFTLGTETKESAGRFCLYRIARDIAAQNGDLAAAFEAIAKLDNDFAVDRLQQQLDAAVTSRKAAKRNAAQSLTLLAPLTEEAVDFDRYALAKSLAEVTGQFAKDAGDSASAKKFAERAAEIDTFVAEHARAQPAFAILKIEPRDPAANLEAGKYLCFVKGDWRRGAPLLALGDDKALAAAAALELAANPDPLATGDMWWKVAESMEEPQRARIRARAADWYRKAAPGLAGLAKAAVERRIKEFGRPEAAAPQVAGAPPQVAAPAANPAPNFQPPKLSAESKKAINAGLEYLIKNQRPDGSWSFKAVVPNPGELEAPIVSTGMALLPFLRNGHTHKAGSYKKEVEAGLFYIISRMKIVGKNGNLRDAGATMYGHGIATSALCEAYALTQDKALQTPAQYAVNFIVDAQDPVGGGWRYQPKQPGDTSVLGWQLKALKTADDAGLTVPNAAFAGANKFLDVVQSDNGSKFGYTDTGAGAATTAVGLLARLQLGASPDSGRITRGVEFLAKSGPSRINLYFNYYATQALKDSGAPEAKGWNKTLREQLLDTQEKNGDTAGSWYQGGNGDHGMSHGGRLYCTSMSLCILTFMEN